MRFRVVLTLHEACSTCYISRPTPWRAGRTEAKAADPGQETTSEQTMTTRDTHDTADELDDILTLVSQDAARCILTTASNRPCTAEELAEECGVSPPTVYRHVTELQEHGFLDEKIRVDESGDHVREFETALESICFTFADGVADAEIRVREEELQ